LLRPTPAATESIPKTPTRDTLYSLLLVAVVIAINIAASLLLSAWQPHIKPTFIASDIPSAPTSLRPTNTVPATLFSSPLKDRRTLGITPIDTPIDRTDAIEFPSANPDDDQ
jgi:hypothetical protein